MSEEEKKPAEEEKKAEEEITEAPAETVDGEESASPLQLEDVGGGDAGADSAGNIDMLMDVTLNVRIELGRTHMSVEQILGLQSGSVVTLEKLAGDYVDVLVNDNLVARGEVLILNDQFCVRIAEIVSPEEREDASIA